MLSRQNLSVCARLTVFTAFCLLLAGRGEVLAQQVDPKAAAVRDYRVAVAFQKKKLFVQAGARWAKFIAAYPKDKRLASAHLNLGVCQFGQQKYTEAAATFRQVLQKFPKFEQRDRLQFNVGMAHYNIATALEEAAAKSQKPDDVQKAAAEYKKAAAEFALLLKQFPKSGQLADALYYQAECLYLSGDKKTAVTLYQQMIAQHAASPFAADAYYGLGTAQSELEQHADAAKTFQMFVQKFPQDERANECRLREGMALYDQMKYVDAAKLFAASAAIKEFSFADFALLRQAQAVQAQDKMPEAAALYESLPKRFTTSGYIGSAFLSAGKCRFRAGQFPNAQQDFQAVIAKKLPEAAEAGYLLGRTFLQLKKPADAVKALDAAVAAYPTSEFLPDMVFTRIDALYEQPPQRPGTAKLFADFVQKYPQHARAGEALYRATFVALEAEDFAAARQHADAFLGNPAFAKHVLKPETMFLGAESCLLAEKSDVAKAEALYRRLIQEYAESDKVPQARVRIGFCLYSAKKYDEAIAFLGQSLAGLKDPGRLAEARLLIGRSHSEAGRAKESIPALRAAIAANPKWDRGDEVLYLLARSLRLEKDVPGAATELNKLTTQYPKSPYRDRAFFQLGEIELERKNYDNAVTQYRKVVAQFPQSETAPLAQYGIGMALFQKPDFKTAVVEISNLLTKYPQAEVVGSGLYLRGTCYHRLGDFAKSAADLTQFLAGGDRPKGGPAEVDALNARYTLGLCQVQLKKFAPAIATFQALLKDKPDYAEADDVYYALAFAYLDAKKEKEAADTFLALATKLPQSPLVPECWFRVGEFRENSEQPAEAAVAFAAGLKTAEQGVALREKLYYKLGWTKYSLESFDEAAKTFDLQIKEFPKGELLADATYLAGESVYRQNKFSQALPYFVAVIAAKAEKYHARALYRAGDCAAGGKQWPESQKHYDALVKQFPKFPNVNEARYGLGFALQNQKKLAEAEQVYLQIIKATNTETAAKARFMMGEIAFSQKNYEKAYEHFLETAVGYPYKEWQALSHFEAGRCQIELKQFDLAKEELETVIKKFPNHPRAKDAKTLLANLN